MATEPLYPSYPRQLLPEKFGLMARVRPDSPVTLTAFNCSDGSIVRLFADPYHEPDIPRPATAKAVARAGSASVTLRWPPPILAPPDPPKWLVLPLFYKPGLAVVRFAEAGRVVDRLTFRVCIARPNGECR